ncbi:MAG: hypothetical protein HY694_03750 [Deltaproteobacteria bacterium]|nr:hypothetical protein [Deltaproteobacteria bacterium]
MKITLSLPQKITVGLATTLALMLASLIPLIARPGEAPAPAGGQTQPASTPPMTDDEFADLLKKADRDLLSEIAEGDIIITPGMTDEEFADQLKKSKDFLDRIPGLFLLISEADIKTAGVPKPAPSQEAQKVEEKKEPSWWESLIPALIPSIGVGGGRDRERREPRNPCAGK